MSIVSVVMAPVSFLILSLLTILIFQSESAIPALVALRFLQYMLTVLSVCLQLLQVHCFLLIDDSHANLCT